MVLEIQGRGLTFAMLLTTTACSSPFRGEEPEPRAAPSELALGSWNLQWFGSPSEGPSDEALQLASVQGVLRETELDVWGLVEVTSATAFQALVSELPGYAGLLA